MVHQRQGASQKKKIATHPPEPTGGGRSPDPGFRAGYPGNDDHVFKSHRWLRSLW